MRLAHLLLPLVLLTACAPTGCAPVQKAIGIVNAPATTLVDEKTVLAAEYGYGVALDTVLKGVQDGRIKGADAARIAVIVRQAEAIRPPLHDALKAANQTNLLLKFNEFRAVAAELAALGAK